MWLLDWTQANTQKPKSKKWSKKLVNRLMLSALLATKNYFLRALRLRLDSEESSFQVARSKGSLLREL
jgi:hypothetical protein